MLPNPGKKDGKYSSEYKCRSYLTFVPCVLPGISSVLEYSLSTKQILYTFDNQIIYMQNKEKKYLYKHVFILSIGSIQVLYRETVAWLLLFFVFGYISFCYLV